MARLVQKGSQAFEVGISYSSNDDIDSVVCMFICLFAFGFLVCLFGLFAKSV